MLDGIVKLPSVIKHRLLIKSFQIIMVLTEV